MQYDLVFQGGGAKGMAFVGAIAEFERRQHSFRRLVGTSAGAINAALIAAGYTAEDMAQALGETIEGTDRPIFESFMVPPTLDELNTVKLNDSMLIKLTKLIPRLYKVFETYPEFTTLAIAQGGFDLIKNGLESLGVEVDEAWWKGNAASIYSLLELGGWYSANNFVTWLERKLDEKDPRFGGATLGSLYQMTGNDLSVCVTDITGAKLLVLNHRTAPNLPVIWAVRMSMSIPFVWPAVTWKSTWGTYTEGNQEHVLTDHRIVDGGALSNFALRLTSTSGAEVKAVMANDPDISDDEFAQFTAKAPTIGFMLDSNIEVPNAGEAPESEGLAAGIETFTHWIGENGNSNNFFTTAGEVLSTMMVGNDNFLLSHLEDNVCRLPVGNIGTLEFAMSDKRKTALVKAAKDATRDFFDARLEFTVNELFMAVNENGKFEIGANITGEAHSRDWIGLFKSPEDAENNVERGNWTYVGSDETVFETITEAQLGQYEARYYAFGSRGLFGNQFRLIKRTGPLNRVVAR